MKKRNAVRDIVIIALFTAILFVQEELLSFLPNIQLTVFLIVLYSKTLGFKKTSIIVLIHVLLDNLVMGSFNLVYTPSMLVGWMIIPLTLSTIFKKANSNITLAFLGIFYAFAYSFCFAIASVILLKVNLWAYLVSDFLFEVLLALSSFLSILLLYNPLKKVIDNNLRRYQEKENIDETQSDDKLKLPKEK